MKSYKNRDQASGTLSTDCSTEIESGSIDLSDIPCPSNVFSKECSDYIHERGKLIASLKKWQKLERLVPDDDATFELRYKEDSSCINVSARKPICDCDHFQHVLIDETVCAGADKVYNAIFGEDSKFLSEVAKRVNMKDLNVTECMRDSDGTIYRYIFHDYPNAFFGKTARNTIRLNFVRNDSANGHHSVSYVNESEGVPFANTFIIHMKLCLLAVSKRRTNIKVSWKIEFIKRIWEMTKTMITKKSIAISQEVMQEYINLLGEMFEDPDECSKGTSATKRKVYGPDTEHTIPHGPSQTPKESVNNCLESLYHDISEHLPLLALLILFFLMATIVVQQYQIKTLLKGIVKTSRWN